MIRLASLPSLIEGDPNPPVDDEPSAGLHPSRSTRAGHPLCSIDGCGRRHKAHGLCDPHYRRTRYQPTARRVTRKPVLDRLMARVEVAPGPMDTPCWVSTYRLDRDGYTRVSLGGAKGRPVFAHRLMYEMHVAPIPVEMEIDHLCRNRACVNPAHLEAVTHLENVRRGDSPSAVAARANLCHQGHSLLEARMGADGRRHCRVCDKARAAA